MSIRTINAKMLARIEDVTALDYRAIEEQAAAILETAVSNRAAHLAVIDRIAAMTPKSVIQTDGTLFVREDRDR